MRHGVIPGVNGPQESPAYLDAYRRGQVIDVRDHMIRFIQRQLEANERLANRLGGDVAKTEHELNAIFLKELAEMIAHEVWEYANRRRGA